MIRFTGMKYFLDLLGINISNSVAAFSFYRNTKDYLGFTTGLNFNFKNLIFYKAGTLNGYDVFYDRTSTYALWFSDIYQYYAFSTISNINKNFYDTNVSAYINLNSPFTPSGTYISETWWGPPFSGGDSVFIPQINNTIVHPDQWATSSSFGILNTGINGSVTGSFFQNSGTGFFNGSAIMKLNGPFNFSNDTILLSYEKLRTGDEILLSSLTGNSFNTYSGFCLGVNNANKLYFKYWNPIEGPFNFTYSNILGDKNLIFLNRYNNVLTIGNFNNNTFQFQSQNFYIKNNSFRQNNELFVGGMYNNIPWLGNTSNFSGYIDKFFIFKNSFLNYINYYASGVMNLFSGTEGGTITICNTTGYLVESGFTTSGETGILNTPYVYSITGITGYSSITTGYSYSGVTGYSQVSIGYYSDNCKNSLQIYNTVPLSGLITISSQIGQPLTGTISITGYNQVPLTGAITGSKQVYVTGEICTTEFSTTGRKIFISDQNYLKSLSFSDIVLFSEINKNSSIVEVYHENYQNKFLDYNNDLNFDFVNSNFFRSQFLNTENILPSGYLLFSNGQLLIDSGYYLFNSGYNTYVTPNLDYYGTGNLIYLDKAIDQNNSLFYDFFTGTSEIIYITGHSSGSGLIGKNFDKKFVFINGQKLISGITYTGQNVINLNIPSGDNFIFIKSVPDFNYYSGNSSSIEISNKNLNCGSTQVYLNGIKQKLNEDYVETSRLDLLSGDFYENLNNYTIYNNSNDFFV